MGPNISKVGILVYNSIHCKLTPPNDSTRPILNQKFDTASCTSSTVLEKKHCKHSHQLCVFVWNKKSRDAKPEQILFLDMQDSFQQLVETS